MEQPDPTHSHALHTFIPSSPPLLRTAFQHALRTLPPPLLNHSLRVFLFAKRLATHEGSPYSGEKIASLFIACIFHDFGAIPAYDGAERFEVCSADAAVAFLEEYAANHCDEADPLVLLPAQMSAQEGRSDIWTAIACHTSPGIAERIHPLARLVRLGVLIDFRAATREKYGAVGYAAEIEGDVPRLEIEKVLGDAVVRQAMEKGEEERIEKAPAASWPGVLVRSHLEDVSWEGVNHAF